MYFFVQLIQLTFSSTTISDAADHKYNTKINTVSAKAEENILFLFIGLTW